MNRQTCFYSKTALRHFNCHGTIHHRKRLDKIMFKCAKCREWSEDLLDLIVDPRLNTAESPNKTLSAVPTPTAD